VGEVYLWTAVSWGQWVVFHKLAVAFEGALTKIRLMAETAAGIDPALDQAGALVILGRLHSEAPRIPLLTGWVSRRSGIAYLRRALAIAPENPACLYFLADALLESDPNGHDEAQALLERCAELLPRADSPVEDLHYVQMARARLARPNLRL
jgi:tetratricopeptide (TPR) repeat protein